MFFSPFTELTEMIENGGGNYNKPANMSQAITARAYFYYFMTTYVLLTL